MAVKWNELVGLNATGLHVSDFVDVYAAITQEFKDIYGSDIDLSTGTADGVYVWQLSLMLNNIIQSLKTLYSNMDVRYAQGQYLDKLCALSNVYRQSATASTASVTLTYIGTDDTSIELTNGITLLDKNSVEWTYDKFNPIITLKANEAQSIIVTCSELGPVVAPAGWIIKTIDNTYNILVNQPNDANIGSDEETDEELRARRNTSLGAIGVSVSEALVGQLMQYSAIQDVKIYNNDTSTTITSKDGTTIPIHDQYIIIRRRQNIAISDETIGTKIYEKMTPGIHTVEYTGNIDYGSAHSYTYTETILGEVLDPSITQKMYWKEATPIAPTITIIVEPLENFATNNNSTCEMIASDVIEYMNSIQLSKDPIIREIENAIYYADPQFRGQTTYNIKSVSIEKSDNPDTYYNYTSTNIEKNEDGDWVITLS